MRADSIVFAIAGSLFGLIVGWVLGSQQAAAGARVTAPVAQTAAAPPAQRAAAAGAARSGAGAGARSGGQQNPNDAQPRVQLGNMYFDAEQYPQAIRWYEQAIALNPNDTERVDRSRRGVLLHEPAGQGDRAVRAVADDRSQAHQDAAEHRHREGVRQAGSRRRRTGVGTGRGARAEQAGGPGGEEGARGTARTRIRTRAGARSRDPRALLVLRSSWRGARRLAAPRGRGERRERRARFAGRPQGRHAGPASRWRRARSAAPTSCPARPSR